MNSSFAYLIVLALVFLSCTGNSDSQVANTKNVEDSIKDIEAIKNVARQEVSGVNASDSSVIFGIVSEDVEILRLNEPSVKGAEAREWFNDFMSTFKAEIQPFTEEEIEVSGDLAYHRYSFDWKLIPKAGGDTIRQQGSGIHILKRNADGNWVIIKDIWHPQTPAPAN